MNTAFVVAMTQIDILFAVASAFGAARGVGESRVSTLVFNDGKRLQRVREGADIGSRSIEKAITWFSEHWPADTAWPPGIERPAPAPSPEVAES